MRRVFGSRWPTLLPVEIATCEWRNVMLFNYAVPPALLAPFLPEGTEPDPWEGSAWVSVVGVTLKHTRAYGIPVPFQQDHCQVGLRFYVRSSQSEDVRPGIVFLKQIPCERHAGEYAWHVGKTGNRMSAEADGRPRIIHAGTHEEFIADRSWSYTLHDDGRTTEQYLQHPSWRIRAVRRESLELSDPGIFGECFAPVLQGAPSTAFLAEGSPVIFRDVRKI